MANVPKKITSMKNWLSNLREYEAPSFFLMAGPCAIEGEDMAFHIAEHLFKVTEELGIPFIFKGSYKKANRTRLDSFTGIGDEKALKILRSVGESFGVPVVTDYHTAEEADFASQYVDVLQVPAFLCRQTELVVAGAKTGRVLNIKKGQFMAPESMKHIAQKSVDSGNSKVMLTDRGTQFGYGDLVVDVRGIPTMKQMGFPVVMDITHSLQQPNQSSGVTGGKPELIETIGRAALAVGADGIFLETHHNPSEAQSDGANMLELNRLKGLLENLLRIYRAAN